jgi:hypothetical protein
MITVPELLRALDKLGVAHAPDLQKALGISQPQLSRLVTEAGDQVARLGRTRGSRYARARTVEGLQSPLTVVRVDESGDLHREAQLHLLSSGRQWLVPAKGEAVLFVGLPPFAADMSPQGYLGHSFSRRHPELGLPERITSWTDNHRLIALARRGEDCVGNLILGDESLDRFLSARPEAVRRSAYPTLAEGTLAARAGSSAGGEQPKFGALLTDGRHVLVKFSGPDDSAASRRNSALLGCEAIALRLLRAEGIPSAEAECVEVKGQRFLEVERFDRMGPRGRRGVLSLGAIDDEYDGHRDSWTQAALRMRADGRISSEDARRILFLEAFGQLIGNTDRHFGNLSFFTGEDRLKLTPTYDMLPMVLAPVGTMMVDRDFKPSPPTAATLEVWHPAAELAQRFWSEVAREERSLKPLARQCGDAVTRLAESTPRLR